MKKYKVLGMSCAACVSRVEKAVLGLNGVTNCTVSLLTNSMTVEGEVSEKDVIAAVTKAGYSATEFLENETKESGLKDKETPKVLKRLIASIVFLVPLMYLSMGHVMWGFYLPSFLANNSLAIALLQMVFALIIMVINRRFFISGARGVIHLSPNMDTLVSMGSLAAFGYSVYMIFEIYSALKFKDVLLAKHLLHGLHFESAGMILALITVGKMLEAKAKGKTTSALEKLMKLAPKTATVIIDGEEKIILTSEVKKGDIFVIKPGEQIPVDGVVIFGSTLTDESALTGESMPVLKEEGSNVFAGTINTNGFIKCKATAEFKDTSLSAIIKMVSDAASTKAPIAKVADKVSGVFVPIVLLIALITFISWMVIEGSLEFAIARAISVLVISCPCALGLATPVAIMVGTGVGAKNGILFKTATSLEQTGKTKIVCLDKTGTITYGKPKVVDIIPNNITKQELLTFAYSLEQNSEHPLSIAINNKAKEENISPFSVLDFVALTGSGVKAKLENATLYGGNLEFIKQQVKISDDIIKKADELSNQGKTPLFFAKDNEFLGIIAVADTIKEEAKETVLELKKLGFKVVMLTGDNQKTANYIANKVMVDKVISEVKPDEKQKAIKELQKSGKVLMVGDGINDAVALTAADIGVAIGKGTGIAIDAADIVLTNESLKSIVTAIKLSRKTLKNIHENLFWAFIYNCFGIPLAAGVFGLTLNPMFSAAAMSLSSVTVVSNALRLNFFKANKKEKKKMTKTIYINGMMCPHCEARVKQILEAVNGVEKAEVSHKKGTAVLSLTKEISNDYLKEIIVNAGYTVTDIK